MTSFAKWAAFSGKQMCRFGTAGFATCRAGFRHWPSLLKRGSPKAPLALFAVWSCALSVTVDPALAQGQSRVPARGIAAEALSDLPFICPMDPDIRSAGPGSCSRCGMKLVLGLPDLAEYPMLLTTDPAGVQALKPVELRFEVLHPDTGNRQVEFEKVHEKLLHLFLVSHDLEEFRHEHPRLGRDGMFRLKTMLPHPGTYRLMGDFYPAGGTPQMVPMTLTTRGFENSLPMLRPQLIEDREPKKGRNLTVSIRTDPPQPRAGFLTLLFFELSTARGLRKFLGAWAHMFAAKDDLVTMMHAHPTIADGGKLIQMNVIFPEPGMYRIWVQVRRGWTVNTVPFTIQVEGRPG